MFRSRYATPRPCGEVAGRPFAPLPAFREPVGNARVTDGRRAPFATPEGYTLESARGRAPWTDEARETEALKRNGIDYDGAMERFGGNAELYERLALKFLDDTHFAALEQALAGGDVDTAVREAHTLKGVAGNLSFAALYEAASKVNAALREGDLAGATALMDPVRSAHAAVVSALSSLRDAR